MQESFRDYLLRRRSEQFTKRNWLGLVSRQCLFVAEPDQQGEKKQILSKLPFQTLFEKAESEYGCSLPDGYKTFISTLGPGIWAGARVLHPELIYPVCKYYPDVDGFIVIIDLWEGDFLAIDPKSHSGDLYVIDTNSCAYGVLSNSVENWLYRATEKFLKDPASVLELIDETTLTDFDVRIMDQWRNRKE